VKDVYFCCSREFFPISYDKLTFDNLLIVDPCTFVVLPNPKPIPTG
jgi:hypothetical protein